MTEQNTSISNRRDILKKFAGLGALLPCVSAWAMQESSAKYQPIPDLHSHFEVLLKGSQQIERMVNFTLTPGDLPWQKTLGNIRKGQSVSFFLSGRWWIVKEMDLWTEAGVAFYVRVNGGDMYNPMQNTGTFLADGQGELEIARAVGEFINEQGELFTPKEHYTAAQGHIDGVAVVWKGDPVEGLIELSSNGDVEGLVKSELNRIRHQKQLPDGWQYMYLFGDGGIFHTQEKGHLCCDTHKDVGILQYAVDWPLSPDTHLDWQWIVEKLPASVPEDIALQHDYLSIAIEFDDGKDITYMWSSELPEGKVFQCPLPRWAEIETHVVQRSGTANLGKQLKESRDVFRDYQEYIKGNATRITKVWLIANTVFLRGTGQCCYSDIALRRGAKKQLIL